MEINSPNSASGVYGVNAYAANTLNSERSQVESQNQASAQSDVGPEEARSAQEAFEVNISQEARVMENSSGNTTGTTGGQAGQTSPPPGIETTQAAGASPLPQGSGQGEAARLQASQIVDIVA